jgi:hypothetical protein
MPFPVFWRVLKRFFCFTFQSGIKSMEYDLVAKENLELKEKLEKVISKVWLV